MFIAAVLEMSVFMLTKLSTLSCAVFKSSTTNFRKNNLFAGSQRIQTSGQRPYQNCKKIHKYEERNYNKPRNHIIIQPTYINNNIEEDVYVIVSLSLW